MSGPFFLAYKGLLHRLRFLVGAVSDQPNWSRLWRCGDAASSRITDAGVIRKFGLKRGLKSVCGYQVWHR
jgi:hypothetical protein